LGEAPPPPTHTHLGEALGEALFSMIQHKKIKIEEEEEEEEEGKEGGGEKR